MSSKNKGILFLLLVLALAGVSGYVYKTQSPQFGLDVKGGIRLVYQLVDLKPAQRENLADTQDRVVSRLKDRASGVGGVVEPEVYAKGEDQVVVELPDYSNLELARAVMSSTASIKLYHAKNVTTDNMKFREYVAMPDDNSGKPMVNFTRRSEPNKLITPKDPEYKKMIDGWTLILEGEDLQKASLDVQGNNSAEPNFNFGPEGAKKLEKWCRDFFNQEEKIAFVLDGTVLNVAHVVKGEVLSDRAHLTGQFDPAYAKQLVSLLNEGALPATLKEISSESVDPTIGTAAFDQMVKAGMVAFGVIAVLMLGYYLFPGFIAVIALGLYVLFTLSMMKLLHVTFSLAGMAGFILSVGMAVDANILVFERMKEEMREGRTLLTAVELGFRRAFDAILDSNLCTIFTSLCLMFFGSGAVKGFATTLIMGVIISLFTAVTVTRSLLVFSVSSGIANKPSWFALDRQLFGFKEMHVVEKYKRFFMISLWTMIPGVIFIAMGGIKQNVEFLGGTSATYKVNATITVPMILSNLEKNGIKGANAKISTVNNERYVDIRVPSEAIKADDKSAYDTIKAAAVDVQALDKKQLTSVGGTIQKEMVTNSIKAVIASSVIIVLWLAIRFGMSFGGLKAGLKFGVSAILALLHDLVVVIGLAAIVGYLLHWEVGGLFVTAVLTMIGFSVHDTIVIFDRIRENLRRPHKGEDFAHLCNRSISTSFARSLLTSGTVILTLAIMVVIGTPTVDLKFFCVTMLFGIISGTYSSIYNAAPILWLWDRKVVATKGEEHSIVEEATAEMNRQRQLAMQTAGAGGTKIATPTTKTKTVDRGYGNIKRRDSVIDRSKTEIDDED